MIIKIISITLTLVTISYATINGTINNQEKSLQALPTK
jgi:hypothetical protein